MVENECNFWHKPMTESVCLFVQVISVHRACIQTTTHVELTWSHLFIIILCSKVVIYYYYLIKKSIVK